MNNIKSEKGITLTSLIIYIIAMVIVVGIVATITRYYYSAINDINKEVDVSKEYTKLNSYLSEDVNNPNNVIYVCTADKIVFYNSANENSEDQNSGYNQYTFQDNAIYFNKIKICKGVKECQFIQDNADAKTKFELNIKFNNDEQKNVKYAIRRDNNIKVAEDDVEIKSAYEFEYTGNYEEFIVPKTGNYKIECWGASGGRNNFGGTFLDNAGTGGYASGVINLTKGKKLYIYVGQKGEDGIKSARVLTNPSYNGGGSGIGSSDNDDGGGAGGGATDIRLVSGEWNDFDSLKSRIMVAGGGSGGATVQSNFIKRSGGSGGGVKGIGSIWKYSNTEVSNHTYNATQIAGYKFGIGQDGVTNGNAGGAGAGGGYYGGYSSTDSPAGGAGGGSGFVSGLEDCNAIAENSTESNIQHSGKSIHYSGNKFEHAQLIDGNSTMMSTNLFSTMRGNSGNGFAKITYIKEETTNNIELDLANATAYNHNGFTKNEDNSYNLTTVGKFEKINIPIKNCKIGKETILQFDIQVPDGAYAGNYMNSLRISSSELTNNYDEKLDIELIKDNEKHRYTAIFIPTQETMWLNLAFQGLIDSKSYNIKFSNIDFNFYEQNSSKKIIVANGQLVSGFTNYFSNPNNAKAIIENNRYRLHAAWGKTYNLFYSTEAIDFTNVESIEAKVSLRNDGNSIPAKFFIGLQKSSPTQDYTFDENLSIYEESTSREEQDFNMILNTSNLTENYYLKFVLLHDGASGVANTAFAYIDEIILRYKN